MSEHREAPQPRRKRGFVPICTAACSLYENVTGHCLSSVAGGRIYPGIICEPAARADAAKLADLEAMRERAEQVGRTGSPYDSTVAAEYILTGTPAADAPQEKHGG